MRSSSLVLDSVNFAYGDTAVLDDLNLDVPAQSLFALLGPSGSGKSTLLSLLAGLLPMQTGRISLEGHDITHLPPEKRGIGVVFQSYALFPSMSVFANIAFGVRDSRPETATRVHELATRLEIDDLLDRKPHELSGGQQQRVALARALAPRPKLLLLDEPLSNIDPALRARVRRQLREWLRTWHVTTLLVTHDREDAFWLADHLALLREGHIVQTGTPRDVYARPADRAAAEMLGAVNELPLARDGDRFDFADSPTLALIRPEELFLRKTPSPTAVLSAKATVDELVYVGSEPRALVRLAQVGAQRLWSSRVEPGVQTGDEVNVELDAPPWIPSSP